MDTYRWRPKEYVHSNVENFPFSAGVMLQTVNLTPSTSLVSVFHTRKNTHRTIYSLEPFYMTAREDRNSNGCCTF